MIANIQSILDGTYEEVMNRISTKVPAIKHFDLYFGQCDHPFVDDKGLPLAPEWNRPAEFFEWPQDIKFTPLGLKRKFCDIEFILHLVQDVPQDVDKRTPDAIRAKGHEHTALIGQTQIALEGFNGNQGVNFKHFGTISFVGLMPYRANGLQMIHGLRFKVRIVLDAAKQFYVALADLVPPVDANDQIDIEIGQA